MRSVSLSGLSRTSISESTRKTLVNTFVTVAGMMVITAFTSAATLDWQRGFGGSILLFAVSIGLIFVAARTRNSAWGLATLAAFAGIEGVSLGPIIAHYLRLADGGALVSTCAGLTALTALSCAGYAMTSKRDFSGMRAITYSCTLALILGMLIAAFVPIPGLHVGLAIAGSFLFTLWMVIDVSDIVVGNQTNYVMAALSIYLDAVNIFLSLLRLFGGRR
jgi:modulator of FtsH protease